MADAAESVIDFSNLLKRLVRLRDWAEESAPEEIYIELLEASELCKTLMDPDYPARQRAEYDALLSVARAREFM